MWGFGKILNQSTEVLWMDYVLGPGANTSGAALNQRCGNAEIDIGTVGAIFFTDIGQCAAGQPHTWCVQIAWEDQQATWSYDGTGALDVQVNADSSFVLSGQGQTFNGKFAGAPSKIAGQRAAAPRS